MANDRLVRETKVYRKYFHGKIHLLKVKKVLIERNGIYRIEDEIDEFIVGG